MAALNLQAIELNRILKAHNKTLYDLLSNKGKAIYFPAKGILAQGAAARGKEINATVGTAYEDDGKPMVISSISRLYEIDSRDVFPYAPSEGIKPLREKWQELIRIKNPSLGTQEISMPVVTCGVTNASVL
jgi:aspartate/tyrosine/aromatic aminotransferase